jgi:hypothetical protein
MRCPAEWASVARLGGAAIPALVSITAPLASASASMRQCPAREGLKILPATACTAEWSTCLCYVSGTDLGQCTEVSGDWSCV